MTARGTSARLPILFTLMLLAALSALASGVHETLGAQEQIPTCAAVGCFGGGPNFCASYCWGEPAPMCNTCYAWPGS